jgi:hypothetical protein
MGAISGWDQSEMTNHTNEEAFDCLHCLLWSVIGKFCREHPGRDSEDLLMSLAAVIGDQLATPESAPLQDEFIATINRRIKQRIAFRAKQ